MEYDENNLEKMNKKTDALDHRIVTAICTFHKRTAYRERAFLYPFERILTTTALKTLVLRSVFPDGACIEALGALPDLTELRFDTHNHLEDLRAASTLS